MRKARLRGKPVPRNGANGSIGLPIGTGHQAPGAGAGVQAPEHAAQRAQAL